MCVTAVKVSNFSGHYHRNRSTLDIGVLGYIGIVQHKEHSPEVLSIPPGTPYIHTDIRTYIYTYIHTRPRTHTHIGKIHYACRISNARIQTHTWNVQ